MPFIIWNHQSSARARNVVRKVMRAYALQQRELRPESFTPTGEGPLMTAKEIWDLSMTLHIPEAAVPPPPTNVTSFRPAEENPYAAKTVKKRRTLKQGPKQTVPEPPRLDHIFRSLKYLKKDVLPDLATRKELISSQEFRRVKFDEVYPKKELRTRIWLEASKSSSLPRSPLPSSIVKPTTVPNSVTGIPSSQSADLSKLRLIPRKSLVSFKDTTEKLHMIVHGWRLVKPDAKYLESVPLYVPQAGDIKPVVADLTAKEGDDADAVGLPAQERGWKIAIPSATKRTESYRTTQKRFYLERARAREQYRQAKYEEKQREKEEMKKLGGSVRRSSRYYGEPEESNYGLKGAINTEHKIYSTEAPESDSYGMREKKEYGSDWNRGRREQDSRDSLEWPHLRSYLVEKSPTGKVDKPDWL